MAEEPQKAAVPLRLQADYLRLREEEKSLRTRAANSDEWKARHQEMLDYIREHKTRLGSAGFTDLTR